MDKLANLIYVWNLHITLVFHMSLFGHPDDVVSIFIPLLYDHVWQYLR